MFVGHIPGALLRHGSVLQVSLVAAQYYVRVVTVRVCLPNKKQTGCKYRILKLKYNHDSVNIANQHIGLDYGLRVRRLQRSFAPRPTH